jgi:tRNA (cmo5U34)-methyltransferase
MPDLDFEGDYGRRYVNTIRQSIPAYDALLEIGNAALAALAHEAATALVVGPGRGEELPGIFSALPGARFTLLEPSEQMRRACSAVIAQEEAGARCRLLPQTLQAFAGALRDPFAVVICHHVLHLMPSDQQRQALRQLALSVAPGGVLLVSSYSEPAEAQDLARVLAIAGSRLLRLGMDATTLKAFLAGRNTVVFSLAEALLDQELMLAGLERPQLLLQALASRLWISCRAGSTAAPSAPAGHPG